MTARFSSQASHTPCLRKDADENGNKAQTRKLLMRMLYIMYI